MEVKAEEDVETVEEQNRRQSEQDYEYQSASDNAPSDVASAPPGAPPGSADGVAAQQQTPYVRDGRKIGRNEPCPCGSGKKYKQCHGKLQ